MATSFQHGTSNRHPKWHKELREAKANSQPDPKRDQYRALVDELGELIGNVHLAFLVMADHAYDWREAHNDEMPPVEYLITKARAEIKARQDEDDDPMAEFRQAYTIDEIEDADIDRDLL